MKKTVRRSILVTCLIAMLLGSSISVYAAPKTMPDGNVFDAEYYAQNNPDVVAALGTDEAALYQHYVNYGMAEGRLPYAADAAAPAAQPAARSVTQEALNAAAKTHNYYKGISSEQAGLADTIAHLIADAIMSDPTLTTDLQRVNAAAEVVAGICSQEVYGTDSTKYYRSPYGVFVAGIYTCAGSTRALGRVLDYMGYSWRHANENGNKHQWCILTMDGQTGYADGMGGFAGYGEMRSGMTLPDGRTIYFPQ